MHFSESEMNQVRQLLNDVAEIKGMPEPYPNLPNALKNARAGIEFVPNPELKEVREKVKKQETEAEKRLRLAKEGEDLKREGRRQRYFAKKSASKFPHRPLDTNFAHGFSDPGRQDAILPINQTVGMKQPRPESQVKTMPSKIHMPKKDNFRFSHQNNGRSESAGFNAQSRDFWKTRIFIQNKSGPGYSQVPKQDADVISAKRARTNNVTKR